MKSAGHIQEDASKIPNAAGRGHDVDGHEDSTCSQKDDVKERSRTFDSLGSEASILTEEASQEVDIHEFSFGKLPRGSELCFEAAEVSDAPEDRAATVARDLLMLFSPRVQVDVRRTLTPRGSRLDSKSSSGSTTEGVVVEDESHSAGPGGHDLDDPFDKSQPPCSAGAAQNRSLGSGHCEEKVPSGLEIKCEVDDDNAEDENYTCGSPVSSFLLLEDDCADDLSRVYRILGDENEKFDFSDVACCSTDTLLREGRIRKTIKRKKRRGCASTDSNETKDEQRAASSHEGQRHEEDLLRGHYFNSLLSASQQEDLGKMNSEKKDETRNTPDVLEQDNAVVVERFSDRLDAESDLPDFGRLGTHRSLTPPEEERNTVLHLAAALEACSFNNKVGRRRRRGVVASTKSTASTKDRKQIFSGSRDQELLSDFIRLDVDSMSIKTNVTCLNDVKHEDHNQDEHAVEVDPGSSRSCCGSPDTSSNSFSASLTSQLSFALPFEYDRGCIPDAEHEEYTLVLSEAPQRVSSPSTPKNVEKTPGVGHDDDVDDADEAPNVGQRARQPRKRTRYIRARVLALERGTFKLRQLGDHLEYRAIEEASPSPEDCSIASYLSEESSIRGRCIDDSSKNGRADLLSTLGLEVGRFVGRSRGVVLYNLRPSGAGCCVQDDDFEDSNAMDPLIDGLLEAASCTSKSSATDRIAPISRYLREQGKVEEDDFSTTAAGSLDEVAENDEKWWFRKPVIARTTQGRGGIASRERHLNPDDREELLIELFRGPSPPALARGNSGDISAAFEVDEEPASTRLLELDFDHFDVGHCVHIDPLSVDDPEVQQDLEDADLCSAGQDGEDTAHSNDYPDPRVHWHVAALSVICEGSDEDAPDSPVVDHMCSSDRMLPGQQLLPSVVPACSSCKGACSGDGVSSGDASSCEKTADPFHRADEELPAQDLGMKNEASGKKKGLRGRRKTALLGSRPDEDPPLSAVVEEAAPQTATAESTANDVSSRSSGIGMIRTSDEEVCRSPDSNRGSSSSSWRKQRQIQQRERGMTDPLSW
ncbi:unnamed protein product [Amoebophrya sp. A25]|nr:unnamed protein product [Amoebophrya sp. A25]|eukprot:GSA25T00009926001.1